MSNSTQSLFYKYNPEKRNVFIEIHHGRGNIFLMLFTDFFMMFASAASSIIEVFMRRKFGERYITLSQSLIITIGMFFAYEYILKPFRLKGGLFLMIFTAIYLGFAIYHRSEITKYGTAYDFKRFSLSDGEIAPFWSKIIGRNILGLKINLYRVHVFFEPLIPILIGAFFLLFDFTRAVGGTLFFCGFVFGLKNFTKAQRGRNWVLDNIDKKISNEMKYDIFIGRKPRNETKGLYFPIELPEDEETRQALCNAVEGSMKTTHDIWANDYLN